MKLYLEIHGSQSPNFYMTRNKQVAAACQMNGVNDPNATRKQRMASLKVLFDNKLYRNDFKTFSEYCKATFDFERTYSHYQRVFADIRDGMFTMVNILPANERQARPLAKLPSPELQAQAWTQAQADSGKEQPSNREVDKAVVKIKAELAAEKQRSEEFRAESNERRKKVRDLEEQIDLLKAQPAPEPKKVVVAPDDYETAKAKAAQLEIELKSLRQQQDKLVNDQVKAKLHERQAELDKLEQDKQLLDEVVARKKAYLASLDSDLKRIETHQKVIEENRLHLISLAAFIGDMDPMKDRDTIRRWLALADMHMEAANSIRLVFGDAKPRLAAI